MSLNHLIAEAAALGGMNLCAAGHAWESSAGRGCPYSDECSNYQAVYECSRCGVIDYGERGGPGHQDCMRDCEHKAGSRQDG